MPVPAGPISCSAARSPSPSRPATRCVAGRSATRGRSALSHRASGGHGPRLLRAIGNGKVRSLAYAQAGAVNLVAHPGSRRTRPAGGPARSQLESPSAPVLRVFVHYLVDGRAPADSPEGPTSARGATRLGRRLVSCPHETTWEKQRLRRTARTRVSDGESILKSACGQLHLHPPSVTWSSSRRQPTKWPASWRMRTSGGSRWVFQAVESRGPRHPGARRDQPRHNADEPDPWRTSDSVTASVEAGVTRMQLNREAGEAGLFFPVDPGADATLGGHGRNERGGPAAVRYGSAGAGARGSRPCAPTADPRRQPRREVVGRWGCSSAAEGTLGTSAPTRDSRAHDRGPRRSERGRGLRHLVGDRRHGAARQPARAARRPSASSTPSKGRRFPELPNGSSSR